MAGHTHLSIGEVLSLLQDEFPDVSISKIRFLESQGLVDPERTPSGYRKFYDRDIERLRWVLRQQRDAFLPLKVIKGRLEEHGLTEDDEGSSYQPREFSFAGEAGVPGRAAEPVASGRRGAPGDDRPARADAGSRARAGAPEGGRARPQLFDAGPPYSAYGSPSGIDGLLRRGGRPVATPAAVGASASSGAFGSELSVGAPHPGASGSAIAPRGPVDQASYPPSGSAPGPGGGPPEPAERGGPANHRQPQARARPGRGVVASSLPARGKVATGGSGRRGAGAGRAPEIPAGEDELALEELVLQTGADVKTIEDLQHFGLITPRVVGGAFFYDQEAAVIARLAVSFARHGVEARHLRAYKGAAEREAGMVEQVIMPLLRQRNPDARQSAVQVAEELSQLGGELRAALLRTALAELR